MRLRLKMMFASYSAFSCAFAGCETTAWAQTALPQVDVTVASPIARRAPARPSPQPAPTQPAPTQPAAPSTDTLVGTVPIVTDQFATITVVPNDELRRNGASTLGDLLFEKPGITGSSFAPGASSRPIIRGLDVEPCAHPGEWNGRQRRIRSRRRPLRAGRSAHERQGRGRPRPGDVAVRLASDRRRGRVDQQPHPDLHPRPRHQCGISRRRNVSRQRARRRGVARRRRRKLRNPCRRLRPHVTGLSHTQLSLSAAAQSGGRSERDTARQFQRSPAEFFGAEQRRGRGHLVHFQRGLLRPRAHTKRCALSHSRNRRRRSRHPDRRASDKAHEQRRMALAESRR